MPRSLDADGVAIASPPNLTPDELALPSLPSSESGLGDGDATSQVRVLHVVNGEHYSGAERVQDLLAEHLPGCGYVVDFACLKPDRFPQARRYRQAALIELPMRGRFDWIAARRLTWLIREKQYALVHAHTPRSLLVAALVAKQAGVPLVYHVHSPAGRDSTRRLINRINRWTERFCVRRAARLIAVSPSVRQYMIEQGAPPERVAYVPNGVPNVDTPPRADRPRRWTLGMTALFRPRKGVEVLMEALAAVQSTGLNVRLRAIGPFESDSYQREVQRLSSQLGLDGVVEWAGFVSDVPAELAQIDALILPSLFGEGLPMVVLEAMAAGVPVIASRVEGVPQAIRHRQDGLLVAPGSVSQLARAMEELCVGDVDYSAMSRRAQERHAAHFSAQIMARGVANVYDEILAV